MQTISENNSTHKHPKSQDYKNKPWLCCFTCGRQKGHTSSDCKVSWKAGNHQNNATATDTKGGNQKGVSWYKRHNKA